jgi:cell division protein FtsN
MARGGRSGRNRVASVLFLVGCLGVLGGTFALGFMAGRLWPRPPSAPSLVARGAKEISRPTEPAPALTFYQELTAPLASPPPPKPSKLPRVERSDKPDAAPKSDALPAVELPKPASSQPPSPGPAPGLGAFTVQVGAYKAREPAEALRARLAAAGYEAYVAQVDAPGSVRFRVRVGSFAARDAAQQVADRIGRERPLSAFVTSR